MLVFWDLLRGLFQFMEDLVRRRAVVLIKRQQLVKHVLPIESAAMPIQTPARERGTGALLWGIMAYPGSFWDDVVLAGKDSKASWLAFRRTQSSRVAGS